MFKKNDPLVDVVAKVMQENNLRREVERQVNEDYGIHSKKALPFEKHGEYDRVLAERTAQALSEGWSMKKEELVGNQSKIDANKNGKIDGQDFKMLRAKKDVKEESSSDPDFAAPRPDGSKKSSDIVFKSNSDSANKGQAVTKEPSAPVPQKRPSDMKEEEQLDELSKSTLASYIKKASSDAADAYHNSGVSLARHEPELRDVNKAHGRKRLAGIKMAASKLVKEETIEEKAPPGNKLERMIKHIKSKYSKDGLTDKEKSIAYATAWKAKNKEDK